MSIKSVKSQTWMSQVDFHPGSGAYTLQERIGTEALFKDCEGELFSNPDAVEFYRAVAKRIARQSRRYKIRYVDSL